MKHVLPGIVLLFATSGCGNTELPPIELDAPGGPRLMTGAGRTPEEAYEFAHASIHPQSYNVRRNLEPRGQNLYGAQVALQRLIEALQSMRSLVTPAFQPKFDPYLLKYKGFLREVERNTWGGSFLSDFDQAEREVKSRFAIHQVELVADLAVAKTAPPPAAPPKTEPPPANTPPPTDKVELPAGSKTPAPAAPPTAAPPAAAPSMSYRLAYKAWDRAHDELVATYKEKKDCRNAYEDVSGALALMKAQVPPDRAVKLQIWIEYYADIHAKTKGFTVLPEKTTEKDVVAELDDPARFLRRMFVPEK